MNNIGYYENKISTLKRYAIFPIIEEQKYKLDFSVDKKFYDKQSNEIKNIIDTIFSVYLMGEGALTNNIVFRYELECNTKEEKNVFLNQLLIETQNVELCGFAAFQIKSTKIEIDKFNESAKKIKCLQYKINFINKWKNCDEPRYQILAAFICSESIFYCTIFAIKCWFKSKGMFQNLFLANVLRSYDESLHRDWGAFLFCKEISHILKPFDKNSIEYSKNFKEINEKTKEIILDALSIEDKFTDYILNSNIEDLNCSDLKIYSRLIADNVINQLGFKSIFNVKNPFSWLNEIVISDYNKKLLNDVINWKK